MKTSSQMSNEELRQYIYDNRRELRKNIKEVRELKKLSPLIPNYALTNMTKLEKRMREKAVKNMNREELITVYRDLNYTLNLKSSTAEGAEFLREHFEPFAEKISSLSESLQNKFWNAFKKVYEDTKGNSEAYKYIIFDSGLIDKIYNNTSEDDIAITLINFIKDTEKETGKYASNFEKQIVFGNKLNSLLKQL